MSRLSEFRALRSLWFRGQDIQRKIPRKNSFGKETQEWKKPFRSCWRVVWLFWSSDAPGRPIRRWGWRGTWRRRKAWRWKRAWRSNARNAVLNSIPRNMAVSPQREEFLLRMIMRGRPYRETVGLFLLCRCHAPTARTPDGLPVSWNYHEVRRSLSSARESQGILPFSIEFIQSLRSLHASVNPVW